MSESPVPGPAVQQVIRYAMLGGVLLLGIVVAFLHASGTLGEPIVDPDRSPVAIVLSVLVLGSVGAIPLFHRLIASAPTASRRFQLTLIGLAVCEGAALAGGVLWMLSGSWTLYAVGLGIYVVAMFWLDSGESESGSSP